MHNRRVECEGYRRTDGLWEIEGRIVDTKPFAVDEPYRGHRPAGSDVHNIAIRLTIGEDFVVRDIEVLMPEVPYPTCSGAIPNYRKLIGARIGAGWRKAVNAVVGSTSGCTHARELLFPMATVAFQTLYGWEDATASPEEKARRAAREAADRKDQGADPDQPQFLNGCYSWSSEREVVARLYPRFARPTVSPPNGEDDSTATRSRSALSSAEQSSAKRYA
jgi:hypothetical protein